MNLDGDSHADSDVVDENEALLDAEEDPQQHNGPNAPNKSSEKDSSVGILEVLRHPLHRTAVVSVVGVMLAQQLCGQSFWPYTRRPLTSAAP